MPDVINSTTQILNGSIKVFNLVEFTAQRFGKLVWGGGYFVSSKSKNEKKEQQLSDLLIRKNFYGTMYETELQLSRREDGVQGVIIDIDGDGNSRFSLCQMGNEADANISGGDLNGANRSVFATDENGIVYAAVTFRQINWDQKLYTIREDWGNKKREEVIVYIDLKLQKKISLPGFNATVPPKFQIKESFVYEELGHSPIVLFANYRTTSNKSFGDAVHARGLQTILNNLFIQDFKAAIMTRARYKFLVDDGDEATVIEELRQTQFSDWIGDAILLHKRSNNVSDENIQDTGPEVLASTYEGNAYRESRDDVINKYLHAAGLSPLESGSGGEETVSGTMFSKTGDLETTNLKISAREEQMSALLEIFVFVLNQTETVEKSLFDENDGLMIRIKRNSIMDEMTKLESLKVGDELGILTIEDKIGLFFGTDDANLIANKVEALKLEQQEFMDQQQEMMGGVADENDETDLPEGQDLIKENGASN